MSTDRTADQNRSASKIDPEWIRQLQIGQKLKGDVKNTTRDEVVIVPIPDMRGDNNAQTPEGAQRGPVGTENQIQQRNEGESTSSLDHAVIIDHTASSVIAANKEAIADGRRDYRDEAVFGAEIPVEQPVARTTESISPLDVVVAKLKNQIANTPNLSTNPVNDVQANTPPETNAFPSIPMATPIDNLPFDDKATPPQTESRPQLNTDEPRAAATSQPTTPTPPPTPTNPASSELNETVSDWRDTDADQNGSVERQAPTPVSASRELPDSLNIADEEIQIFVDKIQEKFSDRESIIVAFAGSESNSHVDHTSAVVSREIARRLPDDRVLLIDSDFDRRSLTEACDAESKIGVGNLLTGSETSLKKAIHVNQNRNLDFLPAGTQSVSNWHSAAERSAELCQKLKDRYRVICVSLGDAHRRPASIWALRCDGVFLIVDLEDSSRVVAQSAVSHLHGCGAHVLGCVVAGGK